MCPVIVNDNDHDAQTSINDGRVRWSTRKNIITEKDGVWKALPEIVEDIGFLVTF